MVEERKITSIFRVDIIVTFITIIFLCVLSTDGYTASLPDDHSKAIKIECKKLVKAKEFKTKGECRKHLRDRLALVGIATVDILDYEDTKGEILTRCSGHIQHSGILKYNSCIEKYVNAELGIIKEEPPTQIAEEEITNEAGEEETQIVSIPIQQPAEVVYEKVMPSTYFVYAYEHRESDSEKENNLLHNVSSAMGSAVVILDGVLATNCHVIHQCKEEREWRLETLINKNSQANKPNKCSKNLLLNEIKVAHPDEAGNPNAEVDPFKKAIIIAKNIDTDRCLLSVDNLNAPAVNYRDIEDLKINETVYAVGNPEGFLGVISEGKITRIHPHTPYNLIHFLPGDIEVIQFNAAIRGGSSGGGLYDKEGNLLGITSIGEKDLSRAEPFNFALPASRFIDLLK